MTRRTSPGFGATRHDTEGRRLGKECTPPRPARGLKVFQLFMFLCCHNNHATSSRLWLQYASFHLFPSEADWTDFLHFVMPFIPCYLLYIFLYYYIVLLKQRSSGAGWIFVLYVGEHLSFFYSNAADFGPVARHPNHLTKTWKFVT